METLERNVERRIVSILFADLVGFTALSERLDPEDVATVQEAYFGRVKETIQRYGGRVEKFIGDAAMAVFGSPRVREDDAERAVRAGLALIGSVEQLSASVGLAEGDLILRVGVNTGEVVHEESEGRVTGDTVNTAARLQTAAPPGSVLIGPVTELAVAAVIETEPRGSVELKGKAQPLPVWIAKEARPLPSREHAMGALRAPLVGRSEELSMLRAALERTAEGLTERWTIIAPPGAGKSRLMEEFALSVGMPAKASILRARLRPDVLTPFDPVAQLLAGSLATVGLASRTDARLGPSDVDPVLRHHLRSSGVPEGRVDVVSAQTLGVLFPPTDSVDPAMPVTPGEREERFRAWIEALDALAGNLAIWLIEDVHWAGGDLLAFLDLAGRAPRIDGRAAGAEDHPARRGRLVLSTGRPSLVEREPAWCEDLPEKGTHTILLRPLPRLEATRLITELVGEALPQDLSRAVAERSDGNPLFIEELLRTWVSTGMLVPENGAWRLATAAEEISLPATVQAMYAAQLDDLPLEPRKAARHASVAGRSFPFDSLEAMGVGAPEGAIDALGRRNLLAGPIQDPLLGPSYQFRHALLRDAGYASLARAERARLHLRMAAWLEGAAGPRWAEVAEVIGNHFRAAFLSAPSLVTEIGDGLDREATARLAASWFERAAEAGLEVSAHETARTLLRQALDLTPEADRLNRARRYQRLGDATTYVADMDEGAAAHESAANLFRLVLEDPAASAGDRAASRSGLASSTMSLGLARIQQVRFKEAVALADAALETIGRSDDVESARLLYLRGWGTEAFAHRPEVRGDLEEALALARAGRDRRLELEVEMLLGLVDSIDGGLTPPQLAAVESRTARMAAELEDWGRACRSLRGQALTLADQWRPQAVAALRLAGEMAEAHALTEELAWVDYVWTEIGLVGGEWDAALEAGRRALELADRNAYHRVQVRTWFALSPVALGRGLHELLARAERWFADHEGIFPHSPFGNVMHGAMDFRFASAGLTGQPDIDSEDLVLAWDEPQGMPSWNAAVEAIVAAWVDAHRPDRARQIVERAASWNDHASISALGRGSTALMRSWVFRADGDAESAADAAATALSEFEACRAPWWIARAIRALAAAGGATPRLLHQAEEIERGLGLTGAAR